MRDMCWGSLMPVAAKELRVVRDAWPMVQGKAVMHDLLTEMAPIMGRRMATLGMMM